MYVHNLIFYKICCHHGVCMVYLTSYMCNRLQRKCGERKVESVQLVACFVERLLHLPLAVCLSSVIHINKKW